MGYELGHASLAKWGRSHVAGARRPGARYRMRRRGESGAISETLPAGAVCGIDFSAESVATSLRKNAGAVAAGRCEVRQGDVSRLPYADASFDLVTAFETVYFWPDVSAAFAEVFRVLGPSGVFLIVNEESGDSRWCSIVDGMRTYTADALAGWLRAVGFVDVRSDVRGEGGALCLVARKGPDSVA
ncbi:MAG: class I SAM-dependent methyltransferase [Bilophila wadsworthia]